MSNFWREIQNGLSDCKYWGISEKILRKEYFSLGVKILPAPTFFQHFWPKHEKLAYYVPPK